MSGRIKILFVIGLAIGLFATIIPFANIFSEVIEDIIFFRLVLVAGLTLGAYGILYFRGFYQNLVISLECGIFSLLIMSTYNLLCSGCVDTYNYYKWTLIIVFVSLTITIILRICLSRLLRHLNS